MDTMTRSSAWDFSKETEAELRKQLEVDPVSRVIDSAIITVIRSFKWLIGR